MREYHFQYTKFGQTLAVLLSVIVIFIFSVVVGIYNNLNIVLIIAVSFGLAYLLFQVSKRKVVHTCTAKLGDVSIVFEFETHTKAINFNDLTSYKSYYGKNGPILYLNTKTENFNIAANNNFCKIEDFKTFCDNTIAQLDKYRETHNLSLVHEGSIFTKKGMLYFLIVATLIYLIAFFLESKGLRIALGIGGGFYLFLMWTKYVMENNKSKDLIGS